MFLHSVKYYYSFEFFQPFKNVKSILRHQVGFGPLAVIGQTLGFIRITEVQTQAGECTNSFPPSLPYSSLPFLYLPFPSLLFSASHCADFKINRDFFGAPVVKNAGGMDLIPNLGRFHMPSCNKARGPQPWSLCSRAHELQPLSLCAPTIEVRTPQSLCSTTRKVTAMRSLAIEKACKPSTAKNKNKK